MTFFNSKIVVLDIESGEAIQRRAEWIAQAYKASLIRINPVKERNMHDAIEETYWIPLTSLKGLQKLVELRK